MGRCLGYYLAVINLITFVIAGLDKRAARRSKRRVPENSLFKLALAGGSVGLYLSMFVFRHKTKHSAFNFGLPALIIAQVFVFLFLKLYR
ncbi:MAG: DUF1294 domain-containing protein [Firmicutes bacterium]|jgi:uncharacterized membrane protein YsdA (DUF1294 family)|nr:DUF1294 domain-containing protein [Bacillota bacterium]HQD39620.1 DUF1294 domain-containing protein [Bacillota bacterium]